VDKWKVDKRKVDKWKADKWKADKWKADKRKADKSGMCMDEVRRSRHYVSRFTACIRRCRCTEVWMSEGMDA
jgi:hypothetical protein